MNATTGTHERPSRAIQGAALLYALNGAGFGIAAVLTAWYLARNGELPMTPFGFRSLSGGPFESFGSARFGALIWALVGVCALDVLTASWLWRGRRRGAAAGLASAPPAFALGVGFALPLLLLNLPLRLLLIWMGRRSLR